MSLTPDLTVLLACMRFQLRTATMSEVTSLLTTDLNWETLVQTAIAQGVMPLLYQSLKAIDASRVPSSVMLQLQHLHRMNALNNLSQTKELLQMLERLDKAGIEAIAFKGPVLAASVYGNIALRQFNDLDILVRQQDFWQAKDILLTQGYESSTSATEEIEAFHRYLQISLSHRTPEATMFGRQFQPSLLHSNSERSIDLHWGIPPSGLWQHDRFEHLWENLDRIDLMGRSIQTFSPEATLVVQCLNVAKEPWKRSFKQVCDAAQIVQAHADLNWDSVLTLSSELRCQRLCLRGLQIVHHLLHLPLPEDILAKFSRSQPTSERVFEADCIPSYIQQTWWWEYTDRLKTLDRFGDGLFVTTHYLPMGLQGLTSLVKILLSPNNLDREFWPLPDRLFLLYYLIRPIRLLLKFSPVGKSLAIQHKL
jgi:hypothetical protein